MQREQPVGVIVQLGGQTPLKLTRAARGGRRQDSRNVAGRDRHRRGSPPFRQDRARARRRQPPNGTATSVDEAVEAAARIGYPGARAADLRARRARDGDRVRRGVAARLLRDGGARVGGSSGADRSFLEDAYEVDVDAISDGEHVVIGGVMQHIEDAGIHSGDSACVLPPYIIREADRRDRCARTRWRSPRRSGVVGLINVQFAIQRRRRVRARGESAREPHDAVRLEGDRRAARVAGGAADDGRESRRHRIHRRRSSRRTSR